MTKCYLDANFIVYLFNKNSPDHPLAASKLTFLLSEQTKLYVSPLIIDEFIHAMIFIKRNKKISQKIELKQDLRELLDLPNLTIINPPTDKNAQLQVLEFMEKYKIGPRDSYHLLIMLSNSVDTFATFDNDFAKVFSARILKRL